MAFFETSRHSGFQEICAELSRLAYQLKKTVVLVGMMGSGKSAVGAALARKLGVALLDSDAEIEAAANRTIAEIFDRDGEAFFRSRETEVIARLLEQKSGVLSTGGGAYLAPENRQLISQNGVAVWLRADLELLWDRVRHKDTRPLLRSANPKKTLANLCIAREPSYALAELAVNARSDYSIDEMAEKVIAILLDHGDLLETK
ncbi:MAG: shikimate kinase [Marinosulfonomonas sp.]|nr:shikimate kinase [Marinosulfonomonas sp.]